ncbi:PTS sugar transporter subunit IIA [Ectothiorhodospira lacustris]|uniref:PTS sugar transporter subunit IIA n=1 Tax=Ectothiorhodospira lacustris TaxID=2899127 RepID=UPI001EE85B35|nr:PTS sugar transporter subunit IIA [Ectothiorhodospira lacustris]MCG5500682.1 PTS sugar transporter subunit IIA [Ectothiorhodospira lacustris]MCG5509932.1 PTS sugar transporter subunit IIA [Ectothiorhodospira lacustris]MCG5521186.1 PTS sugar transporter subunit IIA [Ectothiorhodospira lacustris]
MSVGLLIITHNQIGEDLLSTARSMMGTIPLETRCLAVSQSGDPDVLLDRAVDLYQRLNQGDGVLVLTDMYGSTPSNIANRLLQQPKVQVIAGVNLPMLVRVLNYPNLRLHELVNKAISGGHDGILLCETHS